MIDFLYGGLKSRLSRANLRSPRLRSTHVPLPEDKGRLVGKMGGDLMVEQPEAHNDLLILLKTL